MTTSLDMIRGRSNVVTMTNNSGGALIAGDVCIQDATADENVTTTTSAASTSKVFIAAESIGIGAAGKFYESGYCPFVNVSASATRGYFLFTHTVAKQATSASGYAAGAFGRVLKAGTTPSAIIYSATAQISSAGVSRSGATTDNHLVAWDGSNADSIKDGGAAPAASAMVLLGNSTLVSDTATISVASIPSGYRAIQIIAWLRGTQAAASIWCNGLLNDDSAGNYDLIQVSFLNGATSYSTQNAASSFSVGTIPAASATAGMFAQTSVLIAEYAGSNYKVVRVENASCWGTTATTITYNVDSCFWRSTAAITKVSFTTADKFLTGSKMAVYGLA